MEVQCRTEYPELLFCIGFIKYIKVYYAVSQTGDEGYLYFKSKNETHCICKRCTNYRGRDECNLVCDTMIGGDSFNLFMEWWYSNSIMNYEINNNTIRNMVLCEKIALRICYNYHTLGIKYGNNNEVMKLSQNIADFEYIFKQYLVEAKKHINIPIVELHMRRYYHFNYLQNQNCKLSFNFRKRVFESEFGGDKHDMLKQKIYKISQWEDNPYDSEEVKMNYNINYK